MLCGGITAPFTGTRTPQGLGESCLVNGCMGEVLARQ